MVEITISQKNKSKYSLQIEGKRESLLIKLGFGKEVIDLYESAYRKYPVGKTKETSEDRAEMIDEGLTKLITNNLLPDENRNIKGDLV
jgi:hypothetical protein